MVLFSSLSLILPFLLASPLPPSLPPSFSPVSSDKFPVAMSKGSYGTNGGKKVGKEKGREGGQKQQVVLSVDARDLAMQV